MELGADFSISAGTPEVVGQEPRAAPGEPALSTGKVESSQSMFTACFRGICQPGLNFLRRCGYMGWSTYIVPDRQNKHHGGGNGLTHLGETSLLGEDVGVTESRLLSIAVVGGYGVTGISGDV